jgi:hypothetical protein
MFTAQNTEGFSQSDLNLMNEALTAYMMKFSDSSDEDRDQLEKRAHDCINNNWQESGNTIESLSRGL